jgi:hypothetical protein
MLSEELGIAASRVTNLKVKEELTGIRQRIADMRVARMELDHINDEFHRGNITQDFYGVKHKQLITDFVRSRDSIPNLILPKISELAPDVESQGRLSKFAAKLKSNKEFVLGVSQLIVSIISIFGGTPLH